MDPNLIAVFGLCFMILLILLGMNVGVAMFLTGFLGCIIVRNFDAAIGILRQVPSSQAMTYAYCVVPLFVLMGNAAFKSGISDGMFDTVEKWLSRLPGNLACASVVACAVFGAICGSTPATTATIGTVALPQMKKTGYSAELAVGAIAVGGGLGIMIPPSTPMIVYGIATQSSIGQLFAAGVIPGILLTAIIVAQIIFRIKRNPTLAPGGRKCSWSERFRSLKGIAGVVLLFALVLGGMFSGFFTVNEAAAIGAGASIVMMAIMRNCTWKNLKTIIFETVKTSGMVFLMLIGATVFGSFLTLTRLPAQLASTVGTWDVNRYVILAVIIIIYAFLGMVIDALPMILITMPIVWPIISRLGFDAIWFGIIVILVIDLGVITPPVGINCYVMAGVARDVPLATIFKGAVPFCLSIIIAIVLVVLFPQLATWLPTLLYPAG